MNKDKVLDILLSLKLSLEHIKTDLEWSATNQRCRTCDSQAYNMRVAMRKIRDLAEEVER